MCRDVCVCTHICTNRGFACGPQLRGTSPRAVGWFVRVVRLFGSRSESEVSEVCGAVARLAPVVQRPGYNKRFGIAVGGERLCARIDS